MRGATFIFVGIGLGVGILIGIGLSRKKVDPSGPVWRWPDSLDAVVAAPKNHKIIFEDSTVRILEVTLGPYENESMHTHSLPSVMFGGRSNDTAAFDIVYYRYGYDSTKGRYFVKDSIPQHMPAVQPGEGDSGNYMNPEQPHSIRNLSNVHIDVYRVEFKQTKH